MSGAWLVLFIGLWVVCIVLVMLVLGLSRRIEGLESHVAPNGVRGMNQMRERLLGKHLAKDAVESGVVTSADDLAGLLLFVSEHCGPCQLLASDLAAKLDGNRAGGLAEAVGSRVTIITDQSGVFDGLGATAVFVDPDGSVTSRFDVNATPTGIALDDQGVVTEALIANQFHDVEKLARAANAGTTDLNVVMSA